jgi:hypothetical protein
MSQIITLPADGTYRISYYDAGRPYWDVSVGGNTTYQVLLDTNVIAQVSTTTGQGFTPEEFTFMSIAGSHTLMFKVVTMPTYDNTVFFDAIDIELLQSCSSPQILWQPANTVGYWGEGVSLKVVAAGTLPLSYQWYFQGLLISWGTNSTLSFTNLALTDAGAYWVQVTNRCGSMRSDPATLIVNPTGVSLGLYAGLTITGAVGKTFGIQYTMNLNTNWTSITNITLAQPVQLWVDNSVNVVTQGKRFYRVVAVP